MPKIKLTKKERNLITETLLFASTADVCAKWTNKQQAAFVKLALKLGGKPKHLYVVDVKNGDTPKLTQRIVKKFKLKEESV